MGIVSLILGILSFGVCVSLIPLLNILNCITLLLALIDSILGLADLIGKQDDRNGVAIGELILCGLALLFGGARMVIGLITTGGFI